MLFILNQDVWTSKKEEYLLNLCFCICVFVISILALLSSYHGMLYYGMLTSMECHGMFVLHRGLSLKHVRDIIKTRRKLNVDSIPLSHFIKSSR